MFKPINLIIVFMYTVYKMEKQNIVIKTIPNRVYGF